MIQVADKDLNYRIVKDKHFRSIFTKSVYSRVVLNFLLIAIQIFIFMLFLIKFQPYVEIYFGSSILISTLFLMYLANCEGKNEFKLAWLVPVIIFPLFGISAYYLYHSNTGGLSQKIKLRKLKEETNKYSPNKEQVNQILSKYPDAKGLSTYLLNSGNYYPHEKNQIDYFPSGEKFYPSLVDDLQNAKNFIFIEYFIIDVDKTWASILRILEKKVSEGVEVRVLFDGLGSPYASSKKYQKYLRQQGIKVHPFSPLIPFFSTHQNNRDHRKIVVIDGKVAYTGGLNISNEYMNVEMQNNRFKYWKDNAIRIQGSSIQNLTKLFLEDWNIQVKKKHFKDSYNSIDDFEKYLHQDYPTFDCDGMIIPYGDDASNKRDIAENVYIHIISTAKKYLYITTPYMVIDNQLMDALIFAANRGVDVKVIVPSVPDHMITFYIGKTFLKTLVQEGVQVYLYQKGFIHAKTFISDDIVSTVGSVNLDYRSLFHHFECGAVLYNCPITTEIKQDFTETLQDCTKMTLADYKKIPVFYRMIARILRIFAPLM